MEFLLPSSNQPSTVKSKSPSKRRTKRPRSVSLSTPTRTYSNSNTRKERTYAPKKKKSKISRLENKHDSFFNFTDLTKVGTESVNGTVYIVNSNNEYGEDIEEPYRHNQLTNTKKSPTGKSKEKGTGFTYIIKTSQNNKADNLAYEYLVGQWLNQFTSKYDCFLYTYTLYHTDKQTLYHTGKYTSIKKLLDYNNNKTRIENLVNKYKTTTKDVGEIRSIICGPHTNLLLVQEFVEGRTFYDYLKKGILSDHDIWCILYQIYYPLSKLVKKDFYDLNQMNDIKFSKKVTSVDYTKDSFIYDFLSSMRQKINDPLGVRRKK